MSKTPTTNADYRQILDTLPKSTLRRFGYMAEVAIMDAGDGRHSDNRSDTAAETAAYNVAHAATLAWMNA